MAASKPTRTRPSIQITEARAARLHRLVRTLSLQPMQRQEILDHLQVGLRTFYRELELLRRCGIRFRLDHRRYTMTSSPEQAEGLLPFPDPRLSFAEIAELARGEGPAAKRLAILLERVLTLSQRQRARPAKSRTNPSRSGRKPRSTN